jgi:hypothetical protein
MFKRQHGNKLMHLLFLSVAIPALLLLNTANSSQPPELQAACPSLARDSAPGDYEEIFSAGC